MRKKNNVVFLSLCMTQAENTPAGRLQEVCPLMEAAGCLRLTADVAKPPVTRPVIDLFKEQVLIALTTRHYFAMPGFYKPVRTNPPLVLFSSFWMTRGCCKVSILTVSNYSDHWPLCFISAWNKLIDGYERDIVYQRTLALAPQVFFLVTTTFEKCCPVLLKHCCSLKTFPTLILSF